MKVYPNVPEKLQYLTPPEVASLLRVAPKKVLVWIRRCELRAVNVSNAARPRYRISPQYLENFLKGREVQSPRNDQSYRRAPKGGPLKPELGKKLVKQGKAVLVVGKYFRLWNGKTLYF